jgi:hypothetical protein
MQIPPSLVAIPSSVLETTKPENATTNELVFFAGWMIFPAVFQNIFSAFYVYGVHENINITY